MMHYCKDTESLYHYVSEWFAYSPVYHLPFIHQVPNNKFPTKKVTNFLWLPYIDHRRWSKRCTPQGVPTFKKIKLTNIRGWGGVATKLFCWWDQIFKKRVGNWLSWLNRYDQMNACKMTKGIVVVYVWVFLVQTLS